METQTLSPTPELLTQKPEFNKTPVSRRQDGAGAALLQTLGAGRLKPWLGVLTRPGPGGRGEGVWGEAGKL